jgi:hypothetical protein
LWLRWKRTSSRRSPSTWCASTRNMTSPMGPTVVAKLVNGVATSVQAAAEVRRCDGAHQHEYGIYGGVDGDESPICSRPSKCRRS